MLREVLFWLDFKMYESLCSAVPFALVKDASQDRLILDARPPNSKGVHFGSLVQDFGFQLHPGSAGT